MTHRKMQEDEHLHQLALEAYKYPLGALKRQQCLTKMMRLMAQSRRVWYEKTPHYEDALHHTWRDLGQNMGDVPPESKRDLESHSVISWFNHSLKSHLSNYPASNSTSTEKNNPDRTKQTPKSVETEGSSPEQSILEVTRQWVEADLTGDLKETHVPHRPEINCQTLILKRLPPSKSWEQLSTEFDLDISQLSRFFQHHCLPRLSEFGREVC